MEKIIGKNWVTDLLDFEKNGTFLIKNESTIVKRTDILPTYKDIYEAIKQHCG
jgi:hypothetical protein